MFFSEVINNYWNQPQIIANILMGLNFLGAILLGMVLGVERTMRGRAAGLRTYGLVAGASCAIMVIAGYPEYWYGGSAPEYFYPDPGRVIQGIVTGVGFLGAGWRSWGGKEPLQSGQPEPAPAHRLVWRRKTDLRGP